MVDFPNKIDYTPQSNDPNFQVSASVDLSGVTLEDVTVKEVIIGESLLNPSAHAAVTLQSAMYFRPTNWNYFRCQPITINIKDNSGNDARTMAVKQQVYRCDNRHFSVTNSGSVEELTLHSIDESILNDAEKTMQKSWQCSTPAAVVRDAFKEIGVNRFNIIGSTGPGRPYVAESIHPLQVIQQQANVALYNGDDPSFLHYMTIKEQTGESQHNFRALTELMNESGHTPYDIYAADTAISAGIGFSDGSGSPYDKNSFASLALRTAVTFNFPCDYDVLSDILNGVNCEGVNMNEGRFFNLSSGSMTGATGAISQIANLYKSITSSGTAQQQNTCETNVEKYLHKRQARMGMLEKDKIALRITIPWSPWLHVGQQIYFHWLNRYDDTYPQYGSGRYLILHMTHNIQYGGYAVTTLDCIANTFGKRG